LVDYEVGVEGVVVEEGYVDDGVWWLWC